jgi:hypothetical protein
VDATGRVHREPLWVRITRGGEPRIIVGSTSAGSTTGNPDNGNE